LTFQVFTRLCRCRLAARYLRRQEAIRSRPFLVVRSGTSFTAGESLR
jgi:hypothetical protein